jgi:hypothetical protein
MPEDVYSWSHQRYERAGGVQENQTAQGRDIYTPIILK